MSGLSEGELHVQAMRLVCESLAEREKTGLEVDWDVIDHMHDHMDVIFRGIEDQRRDDQDELMHTRKDRDAAHEQICTLRDQMKAEIETLRKELDAAQAETVDVRRQRNNETDRLNATNVVSVQQRDEIAYLRARLDEERSVIAGLRQQLDAANAAWNLQCAGIERLSDCIGKVRSVIDGIAPSTGKLCDIAEALAELDAGTEPTPVAEPLDEENDTCPGK